jgi:hypothetical protein
MQRGRRLARNQLFAQRNQHAATAVRQETEVADADEATRQHMQQKTAQELIDMQSQESLLVLVSGVAPAERNLIILEGDETAVGNRNPMGVGAEIPKHLIGPAERWFAIDNPALGVQLTDQTPEEPGLSQSTKPSVKMELSGSVGVLERFTEFAAEDFTEDAFREKEAMVSRAHPPRVIRR